MLLIKVKVFHRIARHFFTILTWNWHLQIDRNVEIVSIEQIFRTLLLLRVLPVLFVVSARHRITSRMSIRLVTYRSCGYCLGFIFRLVHHPWFSTSPGERIVDFLPFIGLYLFLKSIPSSINKQSRIIVNARVAKFNVSNPEIYHYSFLGLLHVLLSVTIIYVRYTGDGRCAHLVQFRGALLQFA